MDVKNSCTVVGMICRGQDGSKNANCLSWWNSATFRAGYSAANFPRGFTSNGTCSAGSVYAASGRWFAGQAACFIGSSYSSIALHCVVGRRIPGVSYVSFMRHVNLGFQTLTLWLQALFQGHGLEAPRGQEIVLILVLNQKTRSLLGILRFFASN